jgi:myo-inositol catabolism protein IolS
MIYSQISSLSRSLSRISFGGAALSGAGGGYGFGPISESEAQALIRGAWEMGINVYDTAPIYGFGLSEERLGRYLHPDAFVVTKGGVDWHPNKRVNMSNAPKVIERMLLESLKRLQRERIDLYMIHWPDPQVDIRHCLEVLKRYQDSGAIGHIGLCNTNLQDLQRASEVVRIESIQSELNIYNKQAWELLEGQWQDLFSMGWGTFDKGILTGRVHEERKYDSTDARSWAPWWNKKEVAIKIKRVAKLKEILSDYGLNLIQFCLHFNLHSFGITSCIVGAKTREDLEGVELNLNKKIPDQLILEILQKW